MKYSIYYDDVKERWIAVRDGVETPLRETDPWCDGNAIDDAQRALGLTDEEAESIEVLLTWV